MCAAPEHCQMTVWTPLRSTDSDHLSEKHNKNTDHMTWSWPQLSPGGEPQLQQLYICQREHRSTVNDSSICCYFYIWHLLSYSMLCRLVQAGTCWVTVRKMMTPGHSNASRTTLDPNINNSWKMIFPCGLATAANNDTNIDHISILTRNTVTRTNASGSVFCHFNSAF